MKSVCINPYLQNQILGFISVYTSIYYQANFGISCLILMKIWCKYYLRRLKMQVQSIKDYRVQVLHYNIH